MRKPFLPRSRTVKSLVEKPIQDFGTKNAYTDYIDLQRKKSADLEGSSGEDMVYHHVIPICHGGEDTEENCLYLSPEDHTEAHRILSEVTGNSGDRMTYCFMSNLLSLRPEALKLYRQLGAKAASIVKRANQSNTSNRDFQREMAQRSVTSPKGIAARFETGKRLGKDKHRNELFNYTDRLTLSWRGLEIFSTTYQADGSDVLRIAQRIDPLLLWTDMPIFIA